MLPRRILTPASLALLLSAAAALTALSPARAVVTINVPVLQDDSVYQFSGGSLGGGFGTTLYAIDSGGAGHDFVGFLQFNLASLAGVDASDILSAKMWLRTKVAGFGFDDGDLVVQDLIEGWSAGSQTWADPVDAGVFTASTTVGAVNQWYSVDITPLVIGWLDGSATNHGVKLSAPGGTGTNLPFHSNDSTGGNAAFKPYLEVNAVPEPTRAVLLMAGLAALVLRRRRGMSAD